jgi:epoxyqueuosine reductase
LGSFIFLGELFLDIDLKADQPETDHCADCRKCIEACPTGALVQEHLLDATRCISYYTTELKKPPADPKLIGNHILGCDICQLVCPYNKNLPLAESPDFNKEISFDNGWENLSEEGFKNRYSGTILGEYGFMYYKNMALVVNENIGGKGKT